MASTSLLPTHQRFLNGAPVPSSVRRSFRPREKYLILLVFLTFGCVCFGAFFFLPEFKSGMTGNIQTVYKQIQQAGPEFLLPAPPHMDELSEHGRNFRHDLEQDDPHKIHDRNKLLAKIEEEERSQKVLERPDVFPKPSSSSTKTIEVKKHSDNNANEDELAERPDPEIKPVTVPPSLEGHHPLTHKGEDADSETRLRRNKVLEITRCVGNDVMPGEVAVYRVDPMIKLTVPYICYS